MLAQLAFVVVGSMALITLPIDRFAREACRRGSGAVLYVEMASVTRACDATARRRLTLGRRAVGPIGGPIRACAVAVTVCPLEHALQHCAKVHHSNPWSIL